MPKLTYADIGLGIPSLTSFEIPSKYRHKLYTAILGRQGGTDEDGNYHIEPGREVKTLKEAEIVSSEIENGLHAPVLDIDFGAALIPSSTFGHYHLYLDQPMTWRTYKRLLKALAKAGVIEKGYARASIARGYSALRVPGLMKP